MSRRSFLYGVQKPPCLLSPLAKQVEYLKTENLMLRKRLPKRVRLTSDEKKLLVKLGQAIGTGIATLLSIVAYSTYRGWLHHT